MSDEKKVKGPASYFSSIEVKYGYPVGHCLKLLECKTEALHIEMVSCLKTEHNLGHGPANSLVAHFHKREN